MIPVFLFIVEVYAVNFEELTTNTLLQISYAPWAVDIRHYDDLPEPERYQVMRNDFAFDAWLAKKARNENLTLNSQEQQIISKRKAELEYFTVISRLTEKINVDYCEIKQYAEKWTAPLPERWEVFHIFIDATVCKTRAERKKLYKRALWIKEQLTPENFREFARLWSDAASSAEGGYLGAIALEGLGPTFSAQIKQTPVGTIGGPYETKSGWNIFYIRSYSPPVKRSFSNEELRKMVAKVKAEQFVENVYKSPREWDLLLDELGVQKDEHIQLELALLENLLLATKFINKKTSEVKPTELQLRQIYNENLEKFILPPSRRAREILLTSPDWSLEKTREAWLKRRAVRDRARELRDRILKGEDFAKLARQYSASKTASSGGELGWIQEPSSYIIDTTLSALKIGEVSPPIATEKGYLLLQLLDVQLNKQKSFDESRQICEEMWYYRVFKQIKEELRAQFLKEIKP